MMHRQIRLRLDVIIVMAVSFRLLYAQFGNSVSFPSIFADRELSSVDVEIKDWLLLTAQRSGSARG